MERTMEHAPLAVVTGATGAIGPAVARRLLAEGWRVRAIARRALPGVLPTDATFVACDVRDAKAMASACDGAAAAIHLAARLHTYAPNPSEVPQYHEVNVEGTRSVVEAAIDAGVPRFVFLSTVNVYGPSAPGLPHDEESPPHPRGPYETTKCAAEAAVRRMSTATVLRSAAVYGPAMKGNYARLARAIRAGRFAMVGPGQGRRTLVYEDDLAAACTLAASHPAAAGRTYNVTDGAVHRFCDITAAIANACGRRPPPALPAGPVRAAVRLAERGFSFIGKRPPLTVEALDKMSEDMAVRGERIQDELAFVPRFDLAAGWAAIFAAWNRHDAHGAARE